jgi:hypothetical protein
MTISQAVSIICPIPETVSEMNSEVRLLIRIRRWILLFVVLLILSGLTAFPVQTELHFFMNSQSMFPEFMRIWLVKINEGIRVIADQYPFLQYGYDWLAYSHIVIALFFIGVYRNPVQNAWVLRIGMLACAGVFILASVCGQLRGIPFFWTLIDCSFGLFGIIPLLIVERLIKKLKKSNAILTIENHQI